MMQSEGWKISGHSSPVWRKNMHVKKARTEKHKDMDGKFSVYGEGKDIPFESVWLEQENVAMSQKEDRWRMTRVIGLNDKWPVLLLLLHLEMKAGLRSMVSEGLGFDHAEWCQNAQGMAVETVDTEGWIDGDIPYKGPWAHQCLEKEWELKPN